jgi:hypothetical protein
LDSLADLKNWQRRAREIGRNKCGLICGFAGQYICEHLQEIQIWQIQFKITMPSSWQKKKCDQFCQMVYFQTKNLNLGKF